MPYGMQALSQNLQLIWTDAARGDEGPARAARVADGLVGRLWPGLRGVPGAVAAMRLARGADGVVSVFEHSGLALARLFPIVRGGPLPPMSCRPGGDVHGAAHPDHRLRRYARVRCRRRGAESVRARFDSRHMWTAIASVLRPLSADASS